MLKNSINFVLFQLVWLACIMGAAKQVIWPAIIIFGIFCIWQLHPRNRKPGDIKLVILCLAVGAVLDTIWVRLNLIEYKVLILPLGFAPVWILMLWVALALILNHSLAWLQKKPFLAIILSGIGSPLSYFAGVNLGAAILPENIWPSLLLFGASWAILVPYLFKQARRWAT